MGSGVGSPGGGGSGVTICVLGEGIKAPKTFVGQQAISIIVQNIRNKHTDTQSIIVSGHSTYK